MTESDTGQNRQDKSRFERRLGPVAAMSVGLGTMIGAGIFVLSADAASQAGPAAVVSFAIAGAICVLIAMNVSELATAMPKEGGSYHLISRTLGPIAGAVVGPANWLGLVFAGGFYLIAFGQFMQMMTGLAPWIVVLATGSAVALLNYWGTGVTGQVQRWVVGILIVVLVGFVVRSLFAIESALHRPFAPEGWGAAVGVVGLILVSFTGFEKISTVAEEVKRPGRNLPIAIIGSVVIATILYGAVLFVFTGLIPWREIEPEETALVEASGEALGALGFYGMLGAGLLATLSSANAAVLASSRICFAMGRDRILPGWFGEVHEEHGTPHRAILVTAALSLALGLSGTAARLAEISSSLFIVSYALIAMGVVAMRRIGGDYDPPFRVPFFPVLPALGGLAALAVLTTLEPVSLLVGLGLAAASIAWYFVWARNRTEVEGAVSGWLRERRPLRSLVHGGDTPQRRPGRHVVVGFTEQEEKQQPPTPLLRLGRNLATGLDADLDAVRVRLVPEAMSLDHAWAEIRDDGEGDPDDPVGRSLSERVNTQVHAHTRPARTLAHGVLGATETVGSVELILLAEDSPTFGRGTDAQVRGDYWGDVAVLSRRARAASDPRKLVVGVSTSRHTGLALRLARALARATDARIVLVRVTTEEADELGDENAVRHWAAGAGGGSGDTDAPLVRVVSAPSVAEGLCSEAREADLLLLGAGEHPLRGGRIGRTGRQVLRESDTPALVVWKGDAER